MAGFERPLTGNGTPQARYLVGDQPDQVFGEVGPRAGSSGQWYLTDRQGSVIHKVDDQGNDTRYLGYRQGRVSFYQPLAGDDTGDTREYTGRLFDPATGLQYNRSRWLDPSSGRWTSQDPLGFAAGDTNLYRYAGGSYPNATDPSGHFGVIGGAVGGVLGGIAGYLETGTLEGAIVGGGIGAAAGATAGLTLLGATAWFGTSAGVVTAASVAGGFAGNAVSQGLWGQVLPSREWSWGEFIGSGAGGLLGGPLAARLLGGVAGATGAAGLGRYAAWAGTGAFGATGGDVVAQLIDTGTVDPVRAAKAGLFGAAGGLATRFTLGRVVENYHDHGSFAGILARMLAPEAKLMGLDVCFAAGTPLLTPGGSAPIESLRPGDLVLSADENGPEGAVVPKVVEETFRRYGRLLNLHVGGRIIRTTAEHPFFVYDRGWVPAGELRIGEALRGHDGCRAAVEAVADSGREEAVYNLRVADFHTYFVGCEEWGFSAWAHNSYSDSKMKGEVIVALERQIGNDPKLRPIIDEIANMGELGIAGISGDRLYQMLTSGEIRLSGIADHLGTHEVGQAVRFLMENGGGEFVFGAQSLKGVEGLARLATGDVAVSLKLMHNSGSARGVSSYIKTNGDKIRGTGEVGAVLYGEPIRLTMADIEAQLRLPFDAKSNPGVIHLGEHSPFSRIVLRASDGTLEITPGATLSFLSRPH